MALDPLAVEGRLVTLGTVRFITVPVPWAVEVNSVLLTILRLMVFSMKRTRLL